MARKWRNNLESDRNTDKKKNFPENETGNCTVTNCIDAQHQVFPNGLEPSLLYNKTQFRCVFDTMMWFFYPSPGKFNLDFLNFRSMQSIQEYLHCLMFQFLEKKLDGAPEVLWRKNPEPQKAGLVPMRSNLI